jgi:hypothetical protein
MIKQENILYATNDPDSPIKIADYGLSTMMDAVALTSGRARLYSRCGSPPTLWPTTTSPATPTLPLSSAENQDAGFRCQQRLQFLISIYQQAEPNPPSKGNPPLHKPTELRHSSHQVWRHLPHPARIAGRGADGERIHGGGRTYDAQPLELRGYCVVEGPEPAL